MIVEQNDGTDDKCRQAAHAQRSKCGHEELRNDQADAERHESKTSVVDLQQLQTIEPQQQRQRAGNSGQDRSGVIPLEQQAVNTNQEQPVGNGGVGQHQ